ncbi:ornithine cyclodeaminase, partial [Agrobacterium salinitolerans]|nr:ornithine cyclodeaminase [Agrobacterium salinitolerans]
HNSHGLNIVFPKETKFPNMPVAGPDRRFAAMPGYLGGRFDVCGNKWYGSNHANTQKGLPRSILTMMLNDKDTGAPMALMSANLLSAARTGAVPGVAAKHLANKDAKVVSVVGCGPINKACFTAIMTQLPAVEKVVCFDVFLDKANELARWVAETYKVEAVGVDEAEAGFRNIDVITVAASRLKPLYFKD